MRGHGRLVVGPETGRLRRALGSTAWLVLEELALHAQCGADGNVVVVTNVRRLAVDLGINKDSVARTLARLIGAGIVERRALIRQATGTFGSASYTLHAVPGLVILDPTTPAGGQRRDQRPRVRTAKAEGPAQPGLFELGGHR